jgi:hypothetical protein
VRKRLAQSLIVAVMSVASGLSSTSAVLAQDVEDKKELSKARAQFQRAIELEHAGNWAGALELFREVGQYKMTPQVRFHIGLCEENLGKLVAALGGYELALADAESVGGSFKNEVSQRVADLRGRIPKLVIQRGEGATAAKIELDGVSLGESKIGVPNPVDPGPHIVEARAPRHKPFSETVNLAEEEQKIVSVTLERFPDDAAEFGGSGGPGGAYFGDRPAQPNATMQVLPFIVGGIGVVSLISSGVFFVLRQGAISDIEDRCGGDTDCGEDVRNNEPLRAEVLDLENDVQTYHLLSQITFGVGIVGIGAGIALYVLQPDDDEKANARPQRRNPRLLVAPAAPRATAGVSLIGSF